MNRVICITGASSGIGQALARQLADSSRLVLVARRADRLQALAAAIRDAGGDAEAVVADLTDTQACARVVPAAIARYGSLHALVNNAGAFVTRPAASIDAAHIDSPHALNVRAPMLLTAAALPYLQAAKGGWIVNVSSIVVDNPFPGCSMYTATKAALEGWSRVLREELRSVGVRVGVVAPGATDTPIWPDDSGFDRGRMSRAEDVAHAIRFLLDQPVTSSVDRLVITPPAGKL